MATKKIPQLAARSVALTGDEELEIAYQSASYRLTTENLFKTVGVLPALSGSGNPVPTSGFRIPLYKVSDGQPYSCTLDQALSSAVGTVPAGGTTGQILIKASDADYDTEWTDDPGSPQAANTVLAGPTSGTDADPTFRALVLEDLPTITVDKGGTGRTSLTDHGLLVGAGASAVTQLSAAVDGTLLTGRGVSLDPSFSATPTLGIAGTTKGTLALAGNTSGTVTIQPAAAAGTWSLTLPTSAGTSGHLLQTDGTGVSSWVQQPASGSNQQIQFNDGNSLAGASRLAWDKTNFRVMFNRNAGVNSGAGGVIFQIPSTEIGAGIAWNDGFTNGTFSNGPPSGSATYYDPVRFRGWGISQPNILESNTSPGIWESIEYQFSQGGGQGLAFEWHRSARATGSGAQATFTVVGNGLSTVDSINTAGTNYAVGQRIPIPGSDGTAIVTVSSVNGSGGITGLTILYAGSGLSNGSQTYALSPTEIRLDSWFAPHNMGDGSNFSMSTDNYTWYRYGTSVVQVEFDFSINSMSIYDSNKFVFLVNNVPTIQQINSSGSAVNLIYLDDADVIQVGAAFCGARTGSDATGPTLRTQGASTSAAILYSPSTSASCDLNFRANVGAAEKNASIGLDVAGSFVFRNSSAGGVTYFDNNTGGVIFRNSSFATVFSMTNAGATALTVADANAFSVGANSSTNPVLNVDSSAASVATGINIVGAAAGSRTVVSVTSSGTNEGLSIDAKGTGTIRLGPASTGAIEFSRAAVPTVNDGSALGTTALGWSDLFLASGGVLDWNNGTYTLTQSGTTLTSSGTIATADLIVTNTPRINQVPATIGTGAKTISNAADSSTNFGHYLALNMNGTTYYVPCSAIAPT